MSERRVDPGLAAIESVRDQHSAYEWTRKERGIECVKDGLPLKIWADPPSEKNGELRSRLLFRVTMAEDYSLTRANLRTLRSCIRLASSSGLALALGDVPSLHLLQTRYIGQGSGNGEILSFDVDNILRDASIFRTMLGFAQQNDAVALEVRENHSQTLQEVAEILRNRGIDPTISSAGTLFAPFSLGEQELFLSINTNHAHPVHGTGMLWRLIIPVSGLKEDERNALALNKAECETDSGVDFMGSWISQADVVSFVEFDPSPEPERFPRQLDTMFGRAEWFVREILHGGILKEDIAPALNVSTRTFRPKAILAGFAASYRQDPARVRVAFECESLDEFFSNLVAKKELTLRVNLRFANEDLLRAVEPSIAMARSFLESRTGRPLDLHSSTRKNQIGRSFNSLMWHRIFVSIAIFLQMKHNLSTQRIADILSREVFARILPDTIAERFADRKQLGRDCKTMNPGVLRAEDFYRNALTDSMIMGATAVAPDFKDYIKALKNLGTLTTEELIGMCKQMRRRG